MSQTDLTETHFSKPFERRDGATVCRFSDARVAMTDGQRPDGAIPAGSRPMVLPMRVAQDDLLRFWGGMP